MTFYIYIPAEKINLSWFVGLSWLKLVFQSGQDAVNPANRPTKNSFQQLSTLLLISHSRRLANQDRGDLPLKGPVAERLVREKVEHADVRLNYCVFGATSIISGQLMCY